MKLKQVINPSFKKYFPAALSRLFFTKRRLEQEIADQILQELFQNKGKLTFFKSGRSALFGILKKLKSEGVEQVYIPYRVCNLITLIAERLELKVHYYEQDSLKNLRKDTFTDLPNAAIITVSIWGNELNDARYFNFIRSCFTNQPSIIVDECQNLIKQSLLDSSGLTDKDFVVFSFNDKTIPGFMGGLTWSPVYKLQAVTLSAKEETMMLLYFLSELKNLNKIKRGYKGEYSTCKGLRYGIDDRAMSKISLSVNSLMINKWEEIDQHRAVNYQQLSSDNSLIKNKPANSLAPYIPIEITAVKESGIILKGPYLTKIDEPVEDAVSDGGQVSVINSFRYKFVPYE